MNKKSFEYFAYPQNLINNTSISKILNPNEEGRREVFLRQEYGIIKIYTFLAKNVCILTHPVFAPPRPICLDT